MSHHRDWGPWIDAGGNGAWSARRLDGLCRTWKERRGFASWYRGSDARPQPVHPRTVIESGEAPYCDGAARLRSPLRSHTFRLSPGQVLRGHLRVRSTGCPFSGDSGWVWDEGSGRWRCSSCPRQIGVAWAASTCWPYCLKTTWVKFPGRSLALVLEGSSVRCPASHADP